MLFSLLTHETRKQFRLETDEDETEFSTSNLDQDYYGKSVEKEEKEIGEKSAKRSGDYT